MRKSTRFLAFFLTLLMLVGMLPLSLFALEGGEPAPEPEVTTEFGASMIGDLTRDQLKAAIEAKGGKFISFNDFTGKTFPDGGNTFNTIGDNIRGSSNVGGKASVVKDGDNDVLHSVVGTTNVVRYIEYKGFVDEASEKNGQSMVISFDLKKDGDKVGVPNYLLGVYAYNGGNKIGWIHVLYIDENGVIYPGVGSNAAGDTTKPLGTINADTYTNVAAYFVPSENKVYFYINGVNVLPEGIVLSTNAKFGDGSQFYAQRIRIYDVLNTQTAEAEAGIYYDNVLIYRNLEPTSGFYADSKTVTKTPRDLTRDQLKTAVEALNGTFVSFNNFTGKTFPDGGNTFNTIGDNIRGSSNEGGKASVVKDGTNDVLRSVVGTTNKNRYIEYFGFPSADEANAKNGQNTFISFDLKKDGDKVGVPNYLLGVYAYQGGTKIGWIQMLYIDEDGVIYPSTGANAKDTEHPLGTINKDTYTNVAANIVPAENKVYFYINDVKVLEGGATLTTNAKLGDGSQFYAQRVRIYDVIDTQTAEAEAGIYYDNVLMYRNLAPTFSFSVEESDGIRYQYNGIDAKGVTLNGITFDDEGFALKTTRQSVVNWEGENGTAEKVVDPSSTDNLVKQALKSGVAKDIRSLTTPTYLFADMGFKYDISQYHIAFAFNAWSTYDALEFTFHTDSAQNMIAMLQVAYNDVAKWAGSAINFSDKDIIGTYYDASGASKALNLPAGNYVGWNTISMDLKTFFPGLDCSVDAATPANEWIRIKFREGDCAYHYTDAAHTISAFQDGDYMLEVASLNLVKKERAATIAEVAQLVNGEMIAINGSGWVETTGGNKYFYPEYSHTLAKDVACEVYEGGKLVSYAFDETGKCLGLANGLHTAENGDTRYYVDGVYKTENYRDENGNVYTILSTGKVKAEGLDYFKPVASYKNVTNPNDTSKYFIYANNENLAVGRADAAISGSQRLVTGYSAAPNSIYGNYLLADKCAFYDIVEVGGNKVLKMYNNIQTADSFLDGRPGDLTSYANANETFVAEMDVMLGDDWDTEMYLFCWRDQGNKKSANLLNINKDGYLYIKHGANANVPFYKLSAEEFTRLSVVIKKKTQAIDVYCNGVKVLADYATGFANFNYNNTFYRTAMYVPNTGKGTLYMDNLAGYAGDVPSYVAEGTYAIKDGWVEDKGTVKINGVEENVSTKRFYEDGFMCVNKEKVLTGDSVFDFDAKGVATEYFGWLEIDSKTMYNHKYYGLAEDLIKIDGSFYYFDSDNVLLKSDWVDDYGMYFGADGKAANGIVENVVCDAETVDMMYFKSGIPCAAQTTSEDGKYTFVFDDEGKFVEKINNNGVTVKIVKGEDTTTLVFEDVEDGWSFDVPTFDCTNCVITNKAGETVDEIVVATLDKAYVFTITYTAFTDEEHAWDEGVVKKAASCGSAGLKLYTCADCGKTKTESIAALESHTFGEDTVLLAATCTSEGVKYKACTSCGEIVTETIDMLDHDYVAQAGEITATCKTMGIKVEVCSVCGDVKTTTTPKTTNHTVKADTEEIIAATCISDGLKTYECEVCGQTIAEVLKATDHADADLVEIMVYDEPKDCKTPGHILYQCAKCGEFVEKDGIYGDHVYDDTTYESDATGHWFTCSVCEEKVEFAAHTPVAIKEAVTATCEVEGFTAGSKCSVCAFVIEQSESLGYAEHTFKTTYSMDEESHWKECSVCEAIEEGTEAEHTFVEEVWTTSETHHSKTCSVCGTVSLEHDFDMDNLTDPDYEEGTAIAKCKACNYEKTIEIDTWWEELGLVRTGEVGEYKYALEEPVLDDIVELEDGYHYFDEEGYLVMNDLADVTFVAGSHGVIDNTKVFVTASGAYIIVDGELVVDDEVELDSNTYLARADGKLYSGYLLVEEVYYFYDYTTFAKRLCAKEFFSFGGKEIITDEEGKETNTAWVEIDGSTFYIKDGEYVTGLQEIDEATYYFYSVGIMAKDAYITIEEVEYYFGTDGKLVTE